MLRLYAVNNPEQNLVLKVTDDWIPENTGIYVIGKGNCICDNGKQVEVELSVQELTQLLLGYHPERFPELEPYFKKCSPFISLMLD